MATARHTKKEQILKAAVDEHRRGTKVRAKAQAELQRFRLARRTIATVCRWDKVRCALEKRLPQALPGLDIRDVALRRQELAIESRDYGQGEYRGAYKGWQIHKMRSTIVGRISDIRRLRAVDGVPTVLLPGRRAYWFVPSRGKNWRRVEGWYIARQHIEAKSRRAAIKKAAPGWRAQRVARQQQAEFEARARRTWIDVDAARAAGNCAPGINAWLQAARINAERVGAIRGDYALEIAARIGQRDRVIATIARGHVAQ